MVKGEDGKYTKSYTVEKAYTDATVLTVKNGTEKFGGADGKEVLFDLTGPGTFLVTFDPETKITSVTGDNVKPKEHPSDATSATGGSTTATGTTSKSSSGGSSSSGSSSSSNGAVQTGNASMAVIILLVLVSATAGIYFARKRVK